MKLVIIRAIPFEVFESYLDRVGSAIYNGEDGVFAHDVYDDIMEHPTTIDLMAEDDIDFNVEVVEY